MGDCGSLSFLEEPGGRPGPRPDGFLLEGRPALPGDFGGRPGPRPLTDADRGEPAGGDVSGDLVGDE